MALVGCFSLVCGAPPSLAVAVPGGAATAAAPTPALETLLAKARASSGSPYLYHVVSRSHDLKNGRPAEVTTETQGLKYRAKSCVHSICQGFYFDGDRSYESNFNDTALPLASVVDGLQLTIRAIASYAFTAPDFRAKGGQIGDRDDVLRAGKRYRELAIAPRFGALLDAILDPDTGLVVGVVSDEQRIAFEFRDERKVDGKLMLPYTIVLNGAVFERFEDRRIVGDPLEAPAGLEAKFSGTNAIPFKKADRSVIQAIVPCSIGGQAVACLIDTGDSAMSLSVELAKKLGIDTQTDAIEASTTGRAVAGIARAPAVTVGNATYPQANYLVLRDVHANGYDVVLGADAFAHTKITLDYGARTATFAATDVRGAIGDISFQNFIPIAPIRLNDVPLHLAVDTKDESQINLSYSVYTDHPSQFRATGAASIAGIGGTSEQSTGELRSARLENVDLINLKFVATKNLAATGQGRIGAGLLAHFIATFDYTNLRLTLSPRPGDTSVRSEAKR